MFYTYIDFKIDKHINSVVKKGSFQLKLLTKVKAFLSIDDFERITCAFIMSRLE